MIESGLQGNASCFKCIFMLVLHVTNSFSFVRPCSIKTIQHFITQMILFGS